MAAAGTKPVGAPVWIELGACEAEAQQQVSGAVLGIGATPPIAEVGGYRNLTVEGQPVAVLMGVASEGPHRLVRLRPLRRSGDDARGGRGARRHDRPAADGRRGPRPDGVGRDPSGAQVGLWQAGTFPGTAVESQHGAPCWWDLHAAEHYADPVAFSADALGWDPIVQP